MKYYVGDFQSEGLVSFVITKNRFLIKRSHGRSGGSGCPGRPAALNGGVQVTAERAAVRGGLQAALPPLALRQSGNVVESI